MVQKGKKKSRVLGAALCRYAGGGGCGGAAAGACAAVSLLMRAPGFDN